jgi:hypothetical protein
VSVREIGYADAAAAGTPGTVNTFDSTRIENRYGSDTVSLVDAAAISLREHPVFRNRPVRAILEETGKLLLVGEVRSEDERREAVALIGGVAGVHSVREELEVIPLEFL